MSSPPSSLAPIPLSPRCPQYPAITAQTENHANGRFGSPFDPFATPPANGCYLAQTRHALWFTLRLLTKAAIADPGGERCG